MLSSEWMRFKWSLRSDLVVKVLLFWQMWHLNWKFCLTDSLHILFSIEFIKSEITLFVSLISAMWVLWKCSLNIFWFFIVWTVLNGHRIHFSISLWWVSSFSIIKSMRANLHGDSLVTSSFSFKIISISICFGLETIISSSSSSLGFSIVDLVTERRSCFIWAVGGLLTDSYCFSGAFSVISSANL